MNVLRLRFTTEAQLISAIKYHDPFQQRGQGWLVWHVTPNALKAWAKEAA